ncbi:MAG: hypothetical protein PHR35_07965 [Kiritimatiellae bacterium]|nr:hypothetical protein [Kiritimatiellia bacterium]
MALLEHPLLDRYRAKLAALPASGGGGCHPALLGVASLGVMAGLCSDEIFRDLRQQVHGKRSVPDREIVEAVNKAAEGRSVPSRRALSFRWQPPQQARPAAKAFDAAAFLAARLAEGDGYGEADVWEASPVRIDTPPEQDTVLLLETLFAPDDVLFIGDHFSRRVKSVADWLAAFRAGVVPPPHVIPNPVTGEVGLTKDGRPSLRADACVKSFRFAVAEFDRMSREDQLRFWWAVNLPVCALIDSGGKSLHAWIRIDKIQTAGQWAEEVEGILFGTYLIPLGCDASCRNEARLSRLPGHLRTEKGRWQRILYLAPEGRAIHAGA